MNLETLITVPALYLRAVQQYTPWQKDSHVRFGNNHNVHQLLFTTRCFALRKFSMLNGSHASPHNLQFKSCSRVQVYFNLGPRTTLIRHWLVAYPH